MIGIKIEDLSPWKTGAVFGNESFGEGVKDTPIFLADKLLPEIREHYFADRANTKYIIGGYSLAGLFALWARLAGAVAR